MSNCKRRNDNEASRLEQANGVYALVHKSYDGGDEKTDIDNVYATKEVGDVYRYNNMVKGMNSELLRRNLTVEQLLTELFSESFYSDSSPLNPNYSRFTCEQIQKLFTTYLENQHVFDKTRFTAQVKNDVCLIPMAETSASSAPSPLDFDDLYKIIFYDNGIELVTSTFELVRTRMITK